MWVERGIKKEKRERGDGGQFSHETRYDSKTKIRKPFFLTTYD
jgi:hypothetical protein